MAVKRVSVYAIKLEDVPGNLQKHLAIASADGVDFQCFTACACPGGIATAYLSARNPEALKDCSAKVDVEMTEMAGFLITGNNEIGGAASDLKPLADAGINCVAAAGIVHDEQYGIVVIVDFADADRAANVLGVVSR
jgi:hypothetical protein